MVGQEGIVIMIVAADFILDLDCTIMISPAFNYYRNRGFSFGYRETFCNNCRNCHGDPVLKYEWDCNMGNLTWTKIGVKSWIEEELNDD